MGLATTGIDMFTQYNGITPETFSLTNTHDISNDQLVGDLASEHGYKEVLTDAGLSLGFAGAATLGLNAATGGATAAAGESILSSALIGLEGAGSSAIASLTTLGSGILSSAALPVVVGGVLAAGGLVVGMKIGEKVVADNYDEIDAIVQKFKIGGDKVACWVKDGKTYISEEIIDGLMSLFKSKGYFDDNGFNWNEQTITEFTTLTTANIFTIGVMFVDEMITIGFPFQGLQQIRNTMTTPTDLIDGIGYVAVSVAGSYTNVTLYAYDTKIAKGSITKTSLGYGSYIIEDVQKLVLQLEEAVGGFMYNWSYNHYTQEITYNKSEISPSTEINTPTGGIVSYYYSGNVGTVNANALPKQESATLPTTGSIAVDYPAWAGTRAKVGTHVGTGEEEGTIVGTDALPLGLSIPAVQADVQTGTLTATDAIADGIAEAMTDVAAIADVVVPDPVIPIGDTPIIMPPTSGATTGMIHIYNPTLAQLSAFSAWLWTGNPFENFSKLFQDPMQAIIGLNLLYATPTRALTPTNIVVGNIDSQCPSYYVTEQYIDIDCGSVLVNKYFNNVLDYINTEIQLYLPFIGIVNLSQKEIVGRTISVKYKVDVLTGTCLALVYVGGQLLYQFSGNCAVQLPLTGANYMSIFSTLASVVGAGISGFTLGGIAGAIGGAIGSGVTHAASGGLSHQVQRSGNIGANAGAMGEKKPYLIITRNKPYNPSNYQRYYGYPANTTVRLGDCTGFTRVKDVILKNMITEDGTAATMEELNEIEALLKEGVYL